MCCPNVSGLFIAFSVITYVAIFTLTLLNMIFSIITPKQYETFQMVQYTDYKQPFTYSFLVNLEFGENLVDQTNYGATGSIKSVCYTGFCTINSKKESSANCTKACFDSLNQCYNSNGVKCTTMNCQNYYSSNVNYKCIDHNIIYKWRNYEVKQEVSKYKFTPLYHIIERGQSCKSGYKVCGKINDENDLCLREDEENGCPINKIVVDTSSSSPSDFKYTTKKLGDKYIHFTNQNTKGYIYRSLIVDSDYSYYTSENYEQLDSDTFNNFFKYNPYIYDGEFNKYNSWSKQIKSTWKAYLKKYRFSAGITLEQIKEKQKEYEKKSEIYSTENIKKMNDNVKSFKGVLMGFGIASFSCFACIAIFFIPIYSCMGCGNDCSKSCNCDCELCENITPMKRVLLFYLVCIPTVIFSILGFFFTLSKKSTYSEYSSMEYINEYKNMTKKSRYDDDEEYDYFENSISYNNAQFIILLIILIFLVVYPVLVWLSSPKSEPAPSVQDIKKTANQENNKNKDRNRNKDSTELSFGVGYNSGSNGGYDSSYAQQPNYVPPIQYQQPTQPIYQGAQPYYQAPPGYQPGALYSQ